MNSTLARHYRSETAPPANGPSIPVFDEAHAIRIKALERWENEGGGIPELALLTTRDAEERSDIYLTGSRTTSHR